MFELFVRSIFPTIFFPAVAAVWVIQELSPGCSKAREKAINGWVKHEVWEQKLPLLPQLVSSWVGSPINWLLYVANRDFPKSESIRRWCVQNRAVRQKALRRR